eukprot:TRINITY_DN13938_c0_g1_i1.p1 TRINITY_DN13938_c0_g1~~TRINITY_DN13938_c0_g1_i1.p1  ORF type:complete len:292 (-),score=-6.67 TRINITY_DN13938_c0_g1_i1:139-984(-)
MSLLYDEIWHQSFTAVVATFLGIAYIWSHYGQGGGNSRIDLLSFQYQNVVDRGQYYRLLSSHFLHGNLLHLALNVSTMWGLSVEKIVGTVLFIELTLLLICLCGLTHLLLIKILQNFAIPPRLESELTASSIGYSGIVFGLSAMAIFAAPGSIYSVPILGITIPRLLVPIFNLVVTHFLIPNASLLGHVAGIIAGFAIGLVGSSTPLDSILRPFWVFPVLLVPIFYAASTFHNSIPLFTHTIHKWAQLLPFCRSFCQPSQTIVNGVIVSREASNSELDTIP